MPADRTRVPHPGTGAPEAAPPGPPGAQGPPALPAGPVPEPPEPLRVVVADDNPVVRAGLTALLDGRDGIRVVAEAADGRRACEAALRHRPDLVLLDVRMPGVDGLSALPHLVGISAVLMLTYSGESEIVREALRRGAGGYLVHGEFTADRLVQAVRDLCAGRAHFTVTAADALLRHVREEVRADGGAAGPESAGPESAGPESEGPEAGGPTAGRSPGRPGGLSRMQPTVAQSSPSPVTRRVVNKPVYGLSSREVEVMDLIASGMSNQQIAATCFISEKTVKNHINRIFGKLHSGSRSEAIARWIGTAPSPPPGSVGEAGHG